jgi:hypothetical protein
MPHFNEHADEITPKEYIAKVRQKKFMTPCCRFS